MKQIKRHIKQVSIIVSFIFFNLIIISVISKIYYEFNSGADRSQSLHIELKHNDYYLPKINIDISKAKGRKLNVEVLKNIEKDYTNSWYVKRYALLHNNINSFRDFYTDSAQVKLTEIINYNSKNKISVDMTSLRHNLEVLFFSEDGQLVFMKDKNVEELVTISQNKKTIHQEHTYSNYDVVLLLEDGFWRTRHLIKTNHSEKSTITPIVANKDTLNFSIKGINYYPQDTPWLEFWNQYNENVVDNDFKRIKKLGLNTIRIFIPYDNFGKAEVSLQKIDNLKTTLDLAEKNQLKVIITFFDFYSDYTLNNYTLCDRHLEQIILKIKNHKAILQYDIKNEPDLDFKFHSKAKVVNWLRFITERVKLYDNETPVTIGWSDPEQADILESEVDVVSFHYYKKMERFSKFYNELKAKTNKPIVVQEFGVHSYNSFWFPFSNTEVNQAKYYRNMQEQFSKSCVTNFVSWTLYDFPEIDTSVFGSLPHKIFPQKNYGIIDVEGNYKEASKFLTKHEGSIDTSILNYINKFFVSVTFLLVIFIMIVVKYRKRKK